MNVHDIFDRYERRFAEARLRLPKREPWTEAGREEVRRVVLECLGMREEWRPTIQVETVRVREEEDFRIEFLAGNSWPGVVCTALLYVPKSATPGPRPSVLECCGHGANGKLNPMYQTMARHLARRGMVVLCPDNIGQGEREPMGHANSVAPFACGLSVIGLTLLETMAWVQWAGQSPYTDPTRMAAVGNSGGGKMSMFLAALCPELAVLSSSGHPTTLDFLARKEKKLCHCTILPGMLGRLDLWELLAAFAPKPLLIFQGNADPLFPVDVFYRVARDVTWAYRQGGAPEEFHAEVMEGGHSWDQGRCSLLGNFLARELGLPEGSPGVPVEAEQVLPQKDGCLESWSADAAGIDELAEKLTGIRPAADLKLWDVFPPELCGAEIEQITPRADARQVLAQFEAFLGEERAGER